MLDRSKHQMNTITRIPNPTKHNNERAVQFNLCLLVAILDLHQKHITRSSTAASLKGLKQFFCERVLPTVLAIFPKTFRMALLSFSHIASFTSCSRVLWKSEKKVSLMRRPKSVEKQKNRNLKCKAHISLFRNKLGLVRKELQSNTYFGRVTLA